MTCFCSAPGCGNWLKTISQKQISFTDILRSKIVWSYLPERIWENLFAQSKSKIRFTLKWIAEFELKMNYKSRSDAFCWKSACNSSLTIHSLVVIKLLTAHSRKFVHFGKLRQFVLLVYSLSLKHPFPKHKPSAVRKTLCATRLRLCNLWTLSLVFVHLNFNPIPQRIRRV
jgi:hypothetical protein